VSTRSLDYVLDIVHNDDVDDLVVVDILHQHVEGLQKLPSYLSRIEFAAGGIRTHETSIRHNMSINEQIIRSIEPARKFFSCSNT
jgi:hypothetical protein